MSTEAQRAFTGGRTTFGEPDVRADTLADRAEFLTARLTPVSCRSCGTQVLVRKNSEQHTSIQWTSDPASSCPRYQEEVARGGNTALLDTCIELSESIAVAAAEGEIPIGEDCSQVRANGPEDCSQVRANEPEDCSQVRANEPEDCSQVRANEPEEGP